MEHLLMHTSNYRTSKANIVWVKKSLNEINYCPAFVFEGWAASLRRLLVGAVTESRVM